MPAQGTKSSKSPSLSNPKYAYTMLLQRPLSFWKVDFGRQQGAKKESPNRRRKKSDLRTHCLISSPAQTFAKSPPLRNYLDSASPFSHLFPSPAAFTCLPDLLLTPAPPPPFPCLKSDSESWPLIRQVKVKVIVFVTVI